MSNQGWARLFARSIVGLTFFMAGWGKVFHLTVMMHAERGFVGPYGELGLNRHTPDFVRTRYWDRLRAL